MDERHVDAMGAYLMDTDVEEQHQLLLLLQQQIQQPMPLQEQEQQVLLPQEQQQEQQLQMEVVDSIVHATTDEGKTAIEHCGYLNTNTCFVCSRPYRSLPSQSPYGPNMIEISVATILSQFQNPQLYLRNTTPHNNSNVYYDLHLYEAGTPVPADCQSLNVDDNEYLRIDRVNNTFAAMPFSQPGGQKNWIMLCVEKRIVIPKWTRIRHTRRQR